MSDGACVGGVLSIGVPKVRMLLPRSDISLALKQPMISQSLLYRNRERSCWAGATRRAGPLADRPHPGALRKAGGRWACIALGWYSRVVEGIKMDYNAELRFFICLYGLFVRVLARI